MLCCTTSCFVLFSFFFLHVLFLSFIFSLLLLSKMPLHLQSGASSVPLVRYANTHDIQANTHGHFLRHFVTAAMFCLFFPFAPLPVSPSSWFFVFFTTFPRGDEGENKSRLGTVTGPGQSEQKKKDVRSRLKTASDRRLSCCRLPAGAGGSRAGF